jgi:hypothetical protein
MIKQAIYVAKLQNMNGQKKGKNCRKMIKQDDTQTHWNDNDEQQRVPEHDHAMEECWNEAAY